MCNKPCKTTSCCQSHVPWFDISQSLRFSYGFCSKCKILNQNTIILIDEYDVPLDKAYQSDYYDDIVNLIRTLFGRALKTNDSLKFAILTGCFKISKESIFIGLNNFKVYTIQNVRYKKYFGFTDKEVHKFLATALHLPMQISPLETMFRMRWADASLLLRVLMINAVNAQTDLNCYIFTPVAKMGMKR